MTQRCDISGARVGRGSLRIFVVVAQIILGLLFVFSGLMKGVDPMGTAIKIGEYTSKFGLPFLGHASTELSVVLNVLEALIGVSLLTGVRPRISSLVTVIFLVPMTLLTLYIYIYNPVNDCGCFGDALKISNAATFWKNVVFIILAVFLYRRSDDMWRVLGRSADIPILLCSVLLLVYFNIYPLRTLPVIDFRAYKVGMDLKELTGGEMTDGEYDYRFVYAKDGVERVFSLEELEEVDDTWSYVRDESIELSSPVIAPGADLLLMDREGISQTDRLSQSGQNALLFIVHNLSEVSEEEMNVGAELQSRTGLPVTLVAGNSFEEIFSPQNVSKSVPYADFYFLDRTTAKTVIRSSPGLLVIGDGHIARKASIRQLKTLLKDPKFVEDPYQIMSRSEQQRGVWYTFGVLAVGGLVLVILAIVQRVKKK